MKQPPKPPAHLSAEMAEFWARLSGEYTFSDEHITILRCTCEAWDRMQAARERIKTDGMMLGDKRHPLLGVEAKSMELFLRGLRDLGLEAEANHHAAK